MPEDTKLNCGDTEGACPPGRRNVCNCFGVTYDDLQGMLRETKGASMETLKKYYQVGTRCTSCEYEIKDLITVYREELKQSDLAFAGAQVPLGRRIGAVYRRCKLGLLRRLTARRFGIFVIRRPEIESTLVLSNLRFPEDKRNANGQSTSFRLSLYDASGALRSHTARMSLENDRSCEYTLAELFPAVQGDVTGMVTIDFQILLQVGSLRPYCCLKFGHMVDGFRGRWHYHDKYRNSPYNGFYHCNHPLVRGQECHLAISNPIGQSYRSSVHLRRNDGRIHDAVVEIPANGSLWIAIPELFGLPAGDEDVNALFWFENNQALMVWYFWRKHSAGLWLAQHH